MGRKGRGVKSYGLRSGPSAKTFSEEATSHNRGLEILTNNPAAVTKDYPTITTDVPTRDGGGGGEKSGWTGDDGGGESGDGGGDGDGEVHGERIEQETMHVTLPYEIVQPPQEKMPAHSRVLRKELQLGLL